MHQELVLYSLRFAAFYTMAVPRSPGLADMNLIPPNTDRTQSAYAAFTIERRSSRLTLVPICSVEGN